MSDKPRAKVAFLFGGYPHQSEIFLLNDLRALRKRGLDFLIVATKRLPDIPESEGIDVEVLVRPRFPSLARLTATLRFFFTHPLRCVTIFVKLVVGHLKSPGSLVWVLAGVPGALAIGYELCRRGVTVFMSTHILEIAERMCSRVGILERGQLIAVGTMEELRVQAQSPDGATLEDLFLRLTGGEDVTEVASMLEGVV